MPQWEYRLAMAAVATAAEARLNALGADGWEYVGRIGNDWLFKRPKLSLEERALLAEPVLTWPAGVTPRDAMTGEALEHLRIDAEEGVLRWGEAVKEVRQVRGLTQSELATRAGFGISYISQLETGRRGMSSATMLKIADVLRVPFSYLAVLGDPSELPIVKEMQALVRADLKFRPAPEQET